MQAYKDISTWLEKNIVVEPGELFTVDYINVEAPNMFVLINPDDTVLKISISKIPTPYKYEFMVKGCTHDVFGRPTRTRQIYILNDGGIPAHIKLFSTYDKFDISVLKSQLVDMDKFDFEFDGICKGFQSDVMLPSGTNCLGSIEPGQKFVEKLNEILEKNNSIISGMTTAISRLTDLLALNDTGQDILESINNTNDSINNISNSVTIEGINLPENLEVNANINTEDFYKSEQVSVPTGSYQLKEFNEFESGILNYHDAINLPATLINKKWIWNSGNDYKQYTFTNGYTTSPVIITLSCNSDTGEVNRENTSFSVQFPKYKNIAYDHTTDTTSTITYKGVKIYNFDGNDIIFRTGYRGKLVFEDIYNSSLSPVDYQISDYLHRMCLYEDYIYTTKSSGILSEAFLLKKFSDFSGKYDILFNRSDTLTIGNGSNTVCNYIKITHMLDDGDTYLKGVINVSFKLLSGDEKIFYFSKDIKELELKADITKITFSLPDSSMVTQMLVNIIGGFI